MAKSRVMAVSVGMREGYGVEATFYRYDRSPEQRALGFTDWMQVHGGLTVASAKRMERCVQGGRVIVWPERVAVYKETDDEFWEYVRRDHAEAAGGDAG